MNIKNKKILVTGGKGFIGTNLVNKLKNLGASVSTYDLSDGLDVQNESQLKDFIKRKFDVIYHLAGLSGSKTSNKAKLEFIKSNTLASITLFNLVTKYSPKTKIIISNSRLEYGNPQYLPVDENHPILPTTIYGLSKLATTQLAIIYNKKNDLDVTIFRTSNAYGPHSNLKFFGYNVINYFVNLALANKILNIYGEGKQERDYIFIDDLIEAFLLAIKDRAKGKIYNLGFGKGIKIRDMAKIIVEKIGKGRLKFVKWPDDLKSIETGSYISDITKIKKELGFSPKISFEEGIERTIKSVV